jgi:hypothetical protein
MGKVKDKLPNNRIMNKLDALVRGFADKQEPDLKKTKHIYFTKDEAQQVMETPELKDLQMQWSSTPGYRVDNVSGLLVDESTPNRIPHFAKSYWLEAMLSRLASGNENREVVNTILVGACRTYINDEVGPGIIMRVGFVYKEMLQNE